MHQHKVRNIDTSKEQALLRRGLPSIVAKVLAAREVSDDWFDVPGLKGLLSPSSMKGIHEASEIIASCILNEKKITIVGDYDCDGATATAIGIKGLRAICQAVGMKKEVIDEKITFIVPNRFEFGYGLSPAIVDVVNEQESPNLIITVDNGISSIEGVARAKNLGMSVVVTDHHLPGDQYPDADAIVNPNQSGCKFKSKNIAGCGVMFYTLIYLNAMLRDNGLYPAQPPRLEPLLDLVALGTVADVVRLDSNNRRLVGAGLDRIRVGQMSEGVRALYKIAGADHTKSVASDFGFKLGPRLNAAGRLADMSLGIRCLLATSSADADRLASDLDGMNSQRKEIENVMRKEAEDHVQSVKVEHNRKGVVVAREGWHHGVIGIIASRIKEELYRPTIVMAPEDGTPFYKGSGRSIDGVHLRDVLDLVQKRLPTGAMPKFGGHAMAAGLTIHKDYIDDFSRYFDECIDVLSDPSCFEETINTDGSLAVEDVTEATVNSLNSHIWGQGFPPPLFSDTFTVRDQKILKDRHSRFVLERDGVCFTALKWNSTERFAGQVNVAYRVEKNDYGSGSIQLIVEKFLLNANPEPAPGAKSKQRLSKSIAIGA